MHLKLLYILREGENEPSFPISCKLIIQFIVNKITEIASMQNGYLFQVPTPLHAMPAPLKHTNQDEMKHLKI